METTTTVTTTTTVKTSPQAEKVEIIAILDESGSMGFLRNDVIGGMNTFIDEQKKLPGKVKLSIVKFANTVSKLYNRVKLEEVPQLTEEHYLPSGGTALYDAVGSTLSALIAKEKSKPSNKKYIIAIQTDGEENASCDFSHEKVTKLIKEAEDEYGMDVLFLGANMNVVNIASSLGIKAGKMSTFAASAGGIGSSFSTISAAAANYRGYSKSGETLSSAQVDNFNLQDTYNQIDSTTN